MLKNLLERLKKLREMVRSAGEALAAPVPQPAPIPVPVQGPVRRRPPAR